jgi:hypothetical protein
MVRPTGFDGRRPVLSVLALLGWLLAAVAPPALAQPNLVTNGTFAVTGINQSFQFGTYGGYTSSTSSLAGWSSPNGYNYVFVPTDVLAAGQYGNLSLWSPASSPASANGFTNASPTGGNFVAADGAFGTEAITQTISGLTVGRTYRVSFAWAGAQQSGFTGATTDFWTVKFGTVSQSTSTVSVADKGFSGWMNQTFQYVAASSSQVLSFLATGTPSGVPPFALLANVSVTQVPEPAGVTILLTGMMGLLVMAWRRRGSTGLAQPGVG